MLTHTLQELREDLPNKRNATMLSFKQDPQFLKAGNLAWKADLFFPKGLYGITKRFDRSFDVDGSLLFAQSKQKIMKKYLEKGLYPGVLMNEINLACEDYQYLKQLFKLE